MAFTSTYTSLIDVHSKCFLGHDLEVEINLMVKLLILDCYCVLYSASNYLSVRTSMPFF
jgi:hypothetical protein